LVHKPEGKLEPLLPWWLTPGLKVRLVEDDPYSELPKGTTGYTTRDSVQRQKRNDPGEDHQPRFLWGALDNVISPDHHYSTRWVTKDRVEVVDG